MKYHSCVTTLQVVNTFPVLTLLGLQMDGRNNTYVACRLCWKWRVYKCFIFYFVTPRRGSTTTSIIELIDQKGVANRVSCTQLWRPTTCVPNFRLTHFLNISHLTIHILSNILSKSLIPENKNIIEKSVLKQNILITAYNIIALNFNTM